MWSRDRLRAALGRFPLLVGYLALVIGVVVSFVYMVNITDRIERESLVRAYDNCELSNDTRATIEELLDVLLLEERESDTPGQIEDRRELRAEVNGLLDPVECPPDPSSPNFIETGKRS